MEGLVIFFWGGGGGGIFISSIRFMKNAKKSHYPPEAEYIPFLKKLFS